MAGVVTLPVCAQRPSGHNSVAGHPSPAPHVGSHAPAPRAFSSPTSRASGGPLHRAPVTPAHRQRAAPPIHAARPLPIGRGDHRGGGPGRGDGDRDHRHHRRPYVSPYGFGYAPGYGALGWINPYPLDYTEADSGSSSADNSAAAPSQADTGEYEPQPEEEALPPYPSPAPAFSAPPALESREAVTIVFKDGRPAERIRNYILTRSTLIIGDGPRREIPTDQLDLAATSKANQEAGIDFSLPSISQ